MCLVLLHLIKCQAGEEFYHNNPITGLKQDEEDNDLALADGTGDATIGTPYKNNVVSVDTNVNIMGNKGQVDIA